MTNRAKLNGLRFSRFLIAALLIFGQVFSYGIKSGKISALESNIYVAASSGSTTFTSSAVVVDPNITIDLHNESTVNGASIAINGTVASGDLLRLEANYSMPAGTSYSNDDTKGIMTLTGSFTAAQLQDVFRHITFYSGTITQAAQTSRTISFALGSGLYFKGPDHTNGHFYKVVTSSSINWGSARNAAAASTFLGLQGYLVTITSAEENSFIQSKISANSWLGARDANPAHPIENTAGNDSENGTTYENKWRWVTGPEGLEDSGSGRLFFIETNQTSNGESAGQDLSDFGYTVNGYYSYFGSNEPNDYKINGSVGEDYLHIYSGNGTWNDYAYNNNGINTYIIEYGDMASDSSVIASTKSVLVNRSTVTATQTASTESTVTITFGGLNSNFTSLKYAAVATGSTAPTSAEILAGQYANGNSFIKSASITTSSTSSSHTLSMNSHFLYDLYAIQLSGSTIVNTMASAKTISASTIRAAYTFNNTLSDVTGKKRDLLPVNTSNQAYSGSLTYTDSGAIQKGYSFDGSHVFTLPVDIIQNGADRRKPFTLSMYFKTTSQLGVGLLGYNGSSTFGPGTGGYIPILTIAPDGKLYSILWKGTGDLYVVSNYAVNDGQWHKVTLSAYQTPSNSSTDTLDVYIDGVQVATDSNGTLDHFNMTNVTLGTNYGVGRFTDLTPSAAEGSYAYSTNLTGNWFNPFVGQIDELVIIDGGMSQAQIAEASVDVAIQYELNGGTNPDDTRYLFSKNSSTAYTLPTPLKSNSTFDGWYDNAAFSGSAKTEVPAGTSTAVKYYAKWVAQKAVQFDSNGGSSVATQMIELNQHASAPTQPTKTGFTFVGWYTSQDFTTAFNFANTAIASDITLYAKWAVASYTVKFDSNEGSLVAPQTITYNAHATQPSQPVKAGYTFVGWYKEAALTNSFSFSNDVITQSQTLYAKWAINSYTVSFDENGGSTISDQLVAYLGLVTRPTPPTKTNAVFKGWFKDVSLSQPFDFDHMQITAPTTLYARWASIYTFDFESNDGTYVQGQNIVSGNLATEPSAPTREGYSFSGWYTSQALTTAFDFASSTITQSTTVYAKWTANSYAVVYMNGYSGTPVATQTVTYGNITSAPTQPSRSNYTFVGWSTDSTQFVEWNFSSRRVMQGTTLYAHWSADTYSIVFRDASGNTLSTQSITGDEAVQTPPKPLLRGYRFSNWESSFDQASDSFELTPNFSAIPVNVSNSSQTITPTFSQIFEAVEFTSEDLEQSVSVDISFDVVASQNVVAGDKTAFDQFAVTVLPSGTINTMYLDISVLKVVGSASTVLTELDEPITIQFVVPLEYRNRLFEIIRVHNGVAESIDYTYTSANHSVSFQTDKFSTYGLTVSTASALLIAPSPSASDDEPSTTTIASTQPSTVETTVTATPEPSQTNTADRSSPTVGAVESEPIETIAETAEGLENKADPDEPSTDVNLSEAEQNSASQNIENIKDASGTNRLILSIIIVLILIVIVGLIILLLRRRNRT